jgi:hypothetical protein
MITSNRQLRESGPFPSMPWSEHLAQQNVEKEENIQMAQCSSCVST